MIDTKQKGCW